MKKSFSIVYEDDFLLIVDKSSGIPVIPTRNSEISDSLKYTLKNKYGDIYVVHRIDLETSGLVLFAKDAETHRKCNLLFLNRKINKVYQLFTRGIPPFEVGQIDMPLKKLSSKNRSVISKEGKEALTKYRIVESFSNIAFCESEILTGRHHQIRVHFQYMNCPLLVDSVYGEDGFFLSEIKRKKYKIAKDQIERPLLSRLSLHAANLRFDHPMIDKKIDIHSALPKDLKATLNQLRKTI